MLLVEIAKNNTSFAARSSAVAKLYELNPDNQELFSEIAQNDDDERVRQTTVARVTNQAVLEKIAKNDESELVRRMAITSLSNQTVLAEIAENDESEKARQIAKMRLERLEKLKE